MNLLAGQQEWLQVLPESESETVDLPLRLFGQRESSSSQELYSHRTECVRNLIKRWFCPVNEVIHENGIVFARLCIVCKKTKFVSQNTQRPLPENRELLSAVLLRFLDKRPGEDRRSLANYRRISVNYAVNVVKVPYKSRIIPIGQLRIGLVFSCAPEIRNHLIGHDIGQGHHRDWLRCGPVSHFMSFQNVFYFPVFDTEWPIHAH